MELQNKYAPAEPNENDAVVYTILNIPHLPRDLSRRGIIF
jgi:hypothetical protein